MRIEDIIPQEKYAAFIDRTEALRWLDFLKPCPKSNLLVYHIFVTSKLGTLVCFELTPGYSSVMLRQQLSVKSYLFLNIYTPNFIPSSHSFEQEKASSPMQLCRRKLNLVQSVLKRETVSWLS